jgi:murein DD-endopeptidase MepM/ murein hydrolase activator NlpD
MTADARPYRRAASRRGRFSPAALALLALAALAVAGAAALGFGMVFASAPVVALGAPFRLVGRNAPLVVDVKDARHGLAAVRVSLEQGGTEHVLLDETYDPPRPELHFRWQAAQEKGFRLAEGPGRLRVRARNASWGGFFRGRSASIDQEFTAKLTPPRIQALTTQHYVNQGGCDMVVYRVGGGAVESGVVVGPAFFRGFPLPGAREPDVRFAIFAVPYDAPGATPRLRARDEAANETVASINVRVFPKAFRARTLPLHDAFLEKVVPEIVANTPGFADRGGLVENYLAINRDLRKANNAELAELAGRSQHRFLWSKPFQQLGNSQVEASFADRRTYTYQGREIDRQDHLGYDLATTSGAPVSAANDGIVLKAEFFGIYGNTVVLDHGYGLLSLYGHLSNIGVNVGDTVTRGQEIGRTGATGLAGGDHLHFSIALDSVQVDPKEWWDPHWIADRVTAKLDQFGAGAAPAPAR